MGLPAGFSFVDEEEPAVGGLPEGFSYAAEPEPEPVVPTAPAATAQPSGDSGFDTIEMLMNIPGSAAGVVGDVFNALADPMAVLEGGASLLKGTGDKIGRSLAEFTTGQDLEVMPERSEAAPDAFGQHYSDRYGSWDKAKQTLQDDPVGALMDMPFGPGAIGKAAGFVPKAAATGVMSAGMKLPPKFADKKSKISRKMLDENITPTGGSLTGGGKVDRLLKRTGDQIGGVLEQADASGVRIPIEAPMAGVERAITGTRKGVDFEGKKKRGKLGKYADEYLDDQWEVGRLDMSPSELQGAKLNVQQDINYATSIEPGKQGMTQRARHMVRDESAGILEQVAPGITPLNKRYGELSDVKSAVDTVTGRNVQMPSPFTAGGGMYAGAAGNPAMMGLFGAMEGMRHPAVASTAAHGLDFLGKRAPAVTTATARTRMLDEEDREDGEGMINYLYEGIKGALSP